MTETSEQILLDSAKLSLRVAEELVKVIEASATPTREKLRAAKLVDELVLTAAGCIKNSDHAEDIARLLDSLPKPDSETWKGDK
jgi:hypothetical protein